MTSASHVEQPPPLLAVRNLSRRFGGLAAVDGVSLHVREGEIYSIIGPNGAGKTTFFNLVTGVMPPSSGEIEFRGAMVAGKPQHEIAQLGISRTFQTAQLLLGNTTRENLLMAGHRKTRTGLLDALFRTRRFGRAEADLEDRAEEVANVVGLAGVYDVAADELPTALGQRLAVGMALMSEPALIMLDEPTGGLREGEVDELVELIGRIRASGTTVVLIEHKMRVVMTISDRIAVLNQGQKIAEDLPSVVRADPQVLEAYLGTGYTA